MVVTPALRAFRYVTIFVPAPTPSEHKNCAIRAHPISFIPLQSNPKTQPTKAVKGRFYFRLDLRPLLLMFMLVCYCRFVVWLLVWRCFRYFTQKLSAFCFS